MSDDAGSRGFKVEVEDRLELKPSEGRLAEVSIVIIVAHSPGGAGGVSPISDRWLLVESGLGC